MSSSLYGTSAVSTLSSPLVCVCACPPACCCLPVLPRETSQHLEGVLPLEVRQGDGPTNVLSVAALGSVRDGVRRSGDCLGGRARGWLPTGCCCCCCCCYAAGELTITMIFFSRVDNIPCCIVVRFLNAAGQASHRSLWKYHFQGAKGLLFAVDSSDRQRMPEAKRELLELLEDDQLQDSIIIVLANKQDVPDSMSAQEVAEILSLGDVLGAGRPWFVQPTSAMCGEGVHEAMDWVLANLGKGGLGEGGAGKRGAGLLADKSRHYPEQHLKVAEVWRARQVAEDEEQQERAVGAGAYQRARKLCQREEAPSGSGVDEDESGLAEGRRDGGRERAHGDLDEYASGIAVVSGSASAAIDSGLLLPPRDAKALLLGLECEVPPSPSSSSIQPASSSSSVHYVGADGAGDNDEQDRDIPEGDTVPLRPALVHTVADLIA